MKYCKFLVLLSQDDGIYNQNERVFYHCCFQETGILEEVSEDRVHYFDQWGEKKLTEIDFGMCF